MLPVMLDQHRQHRENTVLLVAAYCRNSRKGKIQISPSNQSYWQYWKLQNVKFSIFRELDEVEVKRGFFYVRSQLTTIQKCSRTELQMMASTNYRSGIPSLSNTPSPGGNDHPMVLVGCCMPRRRMDGTKAALGQRRPPWLKSVSGAHFVSVFYVCLRGRHRRWSRKQANK